MFKNILVPSDLTERNHKAMDIAVKMALENQSCRYSAPCDRNL